jgi:hypothetical protein
VNDTEYVERLLADHAAHGYFRDDDLVRQWRDRNDPDRVLRLLDEAGADIAERFREHVEAIDWPASVEAQRLAAQADPATTAAFVELVGQRRNGSDSDPDIGDMLDGWTPADLTAALNGTQVDPVPILLAPENGRGLFYRGSINCLYGDSGSGKSWLAMRAVREELEAGGRALWVDLEATTSETVARLRGVGVASDVILDRFHYVRPENAVSRRVIPYVLWLVAELGVTMIVVDSVGEAFAVEGVNEDRDNEVGPWLRSTVRPLAVAGVVVVLIDHSTKSKENALYPSGSKRKRAAWTGAGYLVEARPAFSRESAGWLVLTTAKDRHGTYRRGDEVVRVNVEPYPDGGLGFAVHPPRAKAGETAGDKLPDLARRIVTVVRDASAEATMKGASSAMTQREVLAAVIDAGIKGGSDLKRAALDWSVRFGHLTETRGPRGARLYEWVLDVPEDDVT